ncbi:MAG: tetratricopeptide repeat protein, partial [Planctomycetota bacterium]|nr:tetratricopeptide repeat protein [Planctomycetota bacterium]
AVAAAPSNPRYQSALGDCFLALGRSGDAADAYARAVALAPSNPEYIHNMGVAHLRGNAFKKAIEIINEAIKLRPQCAAYYCSRGIASSGLKNTKDAIRDYGAALALDRNNAYAHFLLASAYSDPDDPTYTSSFEAVEHAEAAVRLTRNRNPQYLMGLARALRVARRYDKAVDVAKTAVALDPRDEYKKELAVFEQLKAQGVK